MFKPMPTLMDMSVPMNQQLPRGVTAVNKMPMPGRGTSLTDMPKPMRIGSQPCPCPLSLDIASGRGKSRA